MTDQTIPLEAGLEQRAISFTKGCYVGQEVIVRVLHRGGGRVARRLVGLRFATTELPPAGAAVMAAGREIGRATSVVRSPRLGDMGIALATVHRDYAEPGTRVEVAAGPGSLTAEVSSLPFLPLAPGLQPSEA
jgi:tRNA-modifying protein YgfZ